MCELIVSHQVYMLSRIGTKLASDKLAAIMYIGGYVVRCTRRRTTESDFEARQH